MCILACDDRVVMSSAYVSNCVLGGGLGMSEVYMLNREGESTLP